VVGDSALVRSNQAIPPDDLGRFRVPNKEPEEVVRRLFLLRELAHSTGKATKPDRQFGAARPRHRRGDLPRVGSRRLEPAQRRAHVIRHGHFPFDQPVDVVPTPVSPSSDIRSDAVVVIHQPVKGRPPFGGREHIAPRGLVTFPDLVGAKDGPPRKEQVRYAEVPGEHGHPFRRSVAGATGLKAGSETEQETGRKTELKTPFKTETYVLTMGSTSPRAPEPPVAPRQTQSGHPGGPTFR